MVDMVALRQLRYMMVDVRPTHNIGETKFGTQSLLQSPAARNPTNIREGGNFAMPSLYSVSQCNIVSA